MVVVVDGLWVGGWVFGHVSRGMLLVGQLDFDPRSRSRSNVSAQDDRDAYAADCLSRVFIADECKQGDAGFRCDGHVTE